MVENHVNSDADNELEELIRSLKPDPPDPYADEMNSMRRSVDEMRQSRCFCF